MSTASRNPRAGAGVGSGIATQIYEMVPVASLAPHPKNVNRGDVEAIVSSIRANRFFGAVTAQKSSGLIIAGKHRWLAARECGLQSIPVIWADVDDETAIRIMLADNRTTRLGVDDSEGLAKLLQSLPTLDGTGFDAAALQELLNQLDSDDALLMKPEEIATQTTSQSSRVRAIIDIPPRAWLTMRDEILQSVDAACAQFGMRVTWPD